MSSLRNAAPRRVHRERAQPGFRQKWGLLEKHKDYSLRAADYNLKKRKLSRLREKARDRNPDEFAFGMLRERQDQRTGTRNGQTAEKLSVGTVKLLKRQDAGYLGFVKQRVRRERERLEEEVGLRSGWGAQGKMVFVDGREGQRDMVEKLKNGANGGGGGGGGGDPGRGEDTGDNGEDDDDDVDKTFVGDENAAVRKKQKKSRKEIEAERQKLREDRAAKRRGKRAREARKVKLDWVKKKEKDIQDAQRELDWQRARMSNSVGDVNKNGVKWKIRERKR